jgi:hypothetical protein
MLKNFISFHEDCRNMGDFKKKMTSVKRLLKLHGCAGGPDSNRIFSALSVKLRIMNNSRDDPINLERVVNVFVKG